MSEWFYGREGQQYGPIDEATLRARISTGEVGPKDLIWREGMESWLPLSSVIEFSGPPQIPPNPSAMNGGAPSAIPNTPYTSPVVGATGPAYQPGPSLPATNGLAITSLVCGILSLVFFCFCGGLLLGIPAIVFGHISRNQLNRPDNIQQGHGLALAGLICGYCGLAIFGLLMLQGNVSYNVNDFTSP